MTGLDPRRYRDSIVTNPDEPKRPRLHLSEPSRDDLEFELPEIAKLRRRKLDRIRQRIDAWQHDQGGAA